MAHERHIMATEKNKESAQTLTKTDDAKKQKHRSPAYTSIGLKEAVEKARVIWDAEKRNEVAVDVVAGHWKVAPKSSTTLMAISALKKFGLIDDRGSGDQRYVKLTDLAYNILRAEPNTPEWIVLVQKSALSPTIIAELWESDKENPKSTPSLKKYLEFEKHFNPAIIDEFIQSYRDTISFAKLGIGDRVVTEELVDEARQEENENQVEKPPVTPKKPDPANRSNENNMDTTLNLGELAIPVAGKLARIPFPMSEEDFALFTGTLNLWKNKLVRKLTAIPASVILPAEAIWKNNDTDKPVKIVAVFGEQNGEIFYRSEDGTGIPASQLTFGGIKMPVRKPAN